MEPVKIGILGLGTVGSGTVNVLTRNADEIQRRAGRGIRVVHAAARDLETQTQLSDRWNSPHCRSAGSGERPRG